MAGTHSLQVGLAVIIILTVSGIVTADDGGCPGSSCSFPVYLEPTSDDNIVIDDTSDTLWMEDTFLNGSLVVSNDLTISGINTWVSPPNA